MKKLLMAALASALTCGSAQAAILITYRQVGANVVATQTGSINLGSFTPQGNTSADAFVVPTSFLSSTGPSSVVQGRVYSTTFTGPSDFGTGGGAVADSGTGDRFGVNRAGGIVVRSGYVSGAQTSGTSTYNNQTLSSLGITSGTYVLNVGSGATADTITLVAGAAPEPAAWALMILGFGAVGGTLRRRWATSRRPVRA